MLQLNQFQFVLLVDLHLQPKTVWITETNNTTCPLIVDLLWITEQI